MSIIFKTRLFTAAFFLLLSYAAYTQLHGYAIWMPATIIPILLALQVFLNDLLELYLTHKVRVRGKTYAAFFAPGTIAHEVSHLLAVLASGGEVVEARLWQPNPRSGVLGYVNYSQPKDKWSVPRSLAIAFAPLAGCGLLILAMVVAQNPDVLWTSFTYGLDSVSEASLEMLSAFYFFDFTSPLLWLALYLKVCFALGCAPSSQDFKGFGKSLYQHPFSTLVLLLLAYLVIQGGESTVSLYGVTVSEIILAGANAVILVQLASVTVLAASIPLLATFSAYSKLKPALKAAAIALPLLFYLIAVRLLNRMPQQTATVSVTLFLLLLLLFRYKSYFFKSIIKPR